MTSRVKLNLWFVIENLDCSGIHVIIALKKANHAVYVQVSFISKSHLRDDF